MKMAPKRSRVRFETYGRRTGRWGTSSENNAVGQAVLKGMSCELDSFLGRPCD
jgi:hypothetical protein